MNTFALVFGEILWDLLPDGKVLGGAPANCAYRMLSLGLDVRLVSRVGDDDLGKEVLALLKDQNIDTSYIQIDPTHPTGTVPVELDEGGHPTFDIIKNVAYDYTEYPEAAMESAGSSCKLICFGTLIQRHTVARENLYRVVDALPEATKVVDINLRKDCYTRETVEKSLMISDIVKLNDDEVKTVDEMLSLNTKDEVQFARKIIDTYNLRAVIVTRGDKGCLCVSNDGEVITVDGLKVTVKDTIGAGDAFTAGFAAHYVQGKSLKECCIAGNQLGALVAQSTGGMSSVALDQSLAVNQ